jgi:large subunit ribosomal protein L24
MAKRKMRLKRGDEVRVIAGQFRGAEGKIMAVYPASNRVVVENVNLIKKAQRPTQENPRGGFIEREAPIHASNVQLLDPQTGELTRIGYKIENGQKVRVSVKSGAQLDD